MGSIINPPVDSTPSSGQDVSGQTELCDFWPQQPGPGENYRHLWWSANCWQWTRPEQWSSAFITATHARLFKWAWPMRGTLPLGRTKRLGWRWYHRLPEGVGAYATIITLIEPCVFHINNSAIEIKLFIRWKVTRRCEKCRWCLPVVKPTQLYKWLLAIIAISTLNELPLWSNCKGCSVRLALKSVWY